MHGVFIAILSALNRAFRQLLFNILDLHMRLILSGGFSFERYGNFGGEIGRIGEIPHGRLYSRIEVYMENSSVGLTVCEQLMSRWRHLGRYLFELWRHLDC